jgi:hypothetical protein
MHFLIRQSTCISVNRLGRTKKKSDFFISSIINIKIGLYFIVFLSLLIARKLEFNTIIDECFYLGKRKRDDVFFEVGHPIQIIDSWWRTSRFV